MNLQSYYKFQIKSVLVEFFFHVLVIESADDIHFSTTFQLVLIITIQAVRGN